MLAACSENDLTAEKQVEQQNAEEQVVMFDSYIVRATTRSGWAGTLDTDALKADADGFGVFGYYTNGEVYGETAKPDFMYNQHVTYSGGSWNYSPLKYWPNEFGTNAASEEVDRLTFFAYAPYVEVTPSTGVVTGDNTTGIIGMSRNTATGNPLVKYYANLTPANSVDLCWGVAKATETSSVDGNNNVITEGKPFIDVMKPKVGDKISFDFKHALSQLNVQIDADIDVLSHSTSTLDNNTRIYVRSVTFEGFATKGSLDLNSDFSTSPSQTTPNWYDIAGTGKLSTDAVTIYDGRRDGKEGVENASAKNETPYDLNPAIVQSKAYTTVLPAGKIQYTSFDSDAKDPGVTNDAVNLFNSATAEAPVLVIPTQEDMKITIVYDVETADATLSGYLSDGKTRGSTIENAITQEIKLGDGKAMTLESGKKYTVRLHLGLTSVKFDAEVTNWVDADEADVDLPINAVSTIAKGGTLKETVPASTTSYSYIISGNTESSQLYFVSGTGNYVASSYSVTYQNGGSQVGSDGLGTITVGLNENTTVNKVTSVITVANSGNTITEITQLPHPLGLSLAWASGANADKLIVPTSTATGVTWTSATVVEVKKITSAGVETPLDKVGNSSPSGNEFFVGVNGILLGTGAATGDKYEVTIKVGDADAETKTLTK
jgi:hypothetical protein